MKSKVLAHLKDPDSARFDGVRQVHLSSGGNGSTLDAVCGAVNAKNSMGGYNGFSSFAYVTHVDDRDPADNTVIEHFYQDRFILDESGDDDFVTRFNQQDIAHLCSGQTRFATDDEMLLTSRGAATRVQEARQRQMWDDIHREEARREALSARDQTSQETTVGSSSTAIDDGTNAVTASQ